MKTGIVVIGRNEGQRLVACLHSLRHGMHPVVYVDSGSSDNSLYQADSLGADAIALDMSIPFTAARARNAGFRRLNEKWPSLQFVQFVDGDCIVVDGWLAAAELFLLDKSEFAVTCGRLKEVHPDATVYNQLCDIEWESPAGESIQCGGVAMMRISAFTDVGGFNEQLIAGEEPELCLRLREKGWRIWRLQNPMALHDADIKRFGQWWKRMLRGGFAYGAVFMLHINSGKKIWFTELIRAIFWGLTLPLAILTLSALHTSWAALFLVYPLQVIRIATRRGASNLVSWQYAVFMTIGKFAEAAGILKFLFFHMTKKVTLSTVQR